MNAIDFGRSFIGCKAPDNSVRFWIESRTRITDEASGTTEDFYQCGSCKSENTFGKKDLFYDTNYDFMPIFGTRSGVIFRSHAFETDNYREIHHGDDCLWGGGNYHLVELPARPIRTPEEIRQATRSFAPLVAETEIWNNDTQLRAVFQYPIKTMNIQEANDIYQVDTGPLAFADLSERRETLVEQICLAFVAFNVEHFADFVIEAPTPIIENGSQVTRVPHYSKIVSLEAKNTLYAVEV